MPLTYGGSSYAIVSTDDEKFSEFLTTYDMWLGLNNLRSGDGNVSFYLDDPKGPNVEPNKDSQRQVHTTAYDVEFDGTTLTFHKNQEILGFEFQEEKIYRIQVG